LFGFTAGRNSTAYDARAFALVLKVPQKKSGGLVEPPDQLSILGLTVSPRSYTTAQLQGFFSTGRSFSKT
jgi:hypothetical protein